MESILFYGHMNRPAEAALRLGRLASSTAQNAFQAVPFIPLVILPQVILSDMIWVISRFPLFFPLLSYPLTLTHANSIMREVLLKDASIWEADPERLILLGFILVIVAALLALGRRNFRGLA